MKSFDIRTYSTYAVQLFYVVYKGSINHLKIKQECENFFLFFKVTVQTESERQIDKLRRKEEKRSRRGADYGFEDDFSAMNFSSLLQASEKRSPFDDLIGSGEGSAATALPQGTVRKHYKGYEEVIIPPTPTAPMKPGEKLVNPV